MKKKEERVILSLFSYITITHTLKTIYPLFYFFRFPSEKERERVRERAKEKEREKERERVRLP
jgi:hypothetical protein